jgi:exosortase A
MTAIAADARMGASRHPALVLVLVVWAAILLIHWQTVVSMATIWSSSDTFAHGFLVFPISMWLLWRQRRQMDALRPRPAAAWLVPVALAASLWLVAELATVNVVSHVALVGMLVLSVPVVLGVTATKTVLFPLLFLFFAVPFGEFMLQPMMEWTADFVVAGLQVTGVPVFRHGLQIIIPSGTWSVIDECSGVRYLIASFMVGTLFAYLNYRSYRRRALFMLFSLLVPIIANWLRAYIIVMMGHLSDNRIATGVDHILYGWLFFGFVVFVMFVVGARWTEPDAPGIAQSHSPAPASAPAMSLARLNVVGPGLLTLALVAAPGAYIWALERAVAESRPAQLSLPDRFGSWAADERSISSWKPRFTNPSMSASRVYAGAPGAVGVFVAYYRDQRADRKLITSQNALIAINDRGWIQSNTGSRALGDAVFRTSEIRSADHGAGRSLVTWHSYWIDSRFISSDTVAKLAVAWERLRGRGDDGAMVVLFANEPTVEASRAAVQQFASENLDQLNRLLAYTRESPGTAAMSVSTSTSLLK